MIELPPVLTLAETVQFLAGARVRVWSTASVVDRLQALVPWPVSAAAPPPGPTDWLIAAGGGSLIDRAKALRAISGAKLAALPTIWGSGAEASPIEVRNVGPRKVIRLAAELRPDLIVHHLDLARTVTAPLARQACGDAISHALEGFLSPLGTAETRADLAAVLRRMLTHALEIHPAWFELSALACAGQAKAGVGLVHGLAHVLEGQLGWSHARLCSLYLLPVMAFNRTRSQKWPLLAEHGLDESVVFQCLGQLFDVAAYAEALPTLRIHWQTILRDPCTRINSALVRPSDLEFFASFQT